MNEYLPSKVLISSPARSLAIAAYQTSSPSLRASLSSASARVFSDIRLIRSNRSSTNAPWLGAAPKSIRAQMRTNAQRRFILPCPIRISESHASSLLLQLGEETLTIELSDDAVVHEFRRLFVFEKRIGKRDAFQFKLNGFFARIRFAQHPAQGCVINNVKPLAICDLHLLGDH